MSNQLERCETCGKALPDGNDCQCYPAHLLAELEALRGAATTDIHTRESEEITATLLLNHIDAINGIKHVTACPEDVSPIEHCRAIVAERDRLARELEAMKAEKAEFISLRNHQMQSAYKREEEQRQRADAAERERDEARDTLRSACDHVEAHCGSFGPCVRFVASIRAALGAPASPATVRCAGCDGGGARRPDGMGPCRVCDGSGRVRDDNLDSHSKEPK